MRFATPFSLFAELAMAIACLGLFGQASFTVQQRPKEIGVRTVRGAFEPGIVVLLSKDFLRLVGIAFIVECQGLLLFDYSVRRRF